MDIGKIHSWAFLALAGLTVGGAIRSAAAAEELPTLPGVELTDLAGHKHAIGGRSESRLKVLVFLGTECPVSNGYAPALNRLHAAYTASGVIVLGVHSDPEVDVQVARKHANDYELQFPIVLDRDQLLAKSSGVHKVPTAVVVAPDGRLLYRGRIDNRYEPNGVRRPQATVFDLRNALELALTGQQPNPSTTEPFGCPIPPLRQKGTTSGSP